MTAWRCTRAAEVCPSSPANALLMHRTNLWGNRAAYLVFAAVVLTICVKLLKLREKNYTAKEKLVLIFTSAKFEIGQADPRRGK